MLVIFDQGVFCLILTVTKLCTLLRYYKMRQRALCHIQCSVVCSMTLSETLKAHAKVDVTGFHLNLRFLIKICGFFFVFSFHYDSVVID